MAVARIRTIFTGVAGTPWYSNLYFLDSGSTPIASLASGWVKDFWDDIAPFMLSTVRYTLETLVPTYDEATGNLTRQTAVAPLTGTGSDSTTALPWATQGLIRLRTAGIVNNRAVHGRIFVPGAPEVQSDNGVPVTGYKSGLQAAINTLIASSTSTLAIWARPFPGDLTATPPKPARAGSQHAVSTADVWAQWAVMRSRRD